MSFIEFMSNNLGHVLPIVIAGLLGMMIILERFVALYQVYSIRDLDGFFQRITGLVTTGKLQEGISICQEYSRKPAAQVVKTALSRAHLPETVIQDGLKITQGEARQAIQKRIAYLATIANVATLLGLFGTIMGLIQSFEAVGHADAQQKSALLSNGISSAMNATLLGLAVAIPCMIAFSVLVNRSNLMIDEVETASLRILDILKQRYFSADSGDDTAQSGAGAKKAA